jgi:hypothetical protein
MVMDGAEFQIEAAEQLCIQTIPGLDQGHNYSEYLKIKEQ